MYIITFASASELLWLWPSCIVKSESLYVQFISESDYFAQVECYIFKIFFSVIFYRYCVNLFSIISHILNCVLKCTNGAITIYSKFNFYCHENMTYNTVILFVSCLLRCSGAVCCTHKLDSNQLLLAILFCSRQCWVVLRCYMQ